MAVALAHRIAGHPRLYDLIQIAFGSRAVKARISRLWEGKTGLVLLDLAGGTGLEERFRPPGCRYICLDVDPMKINRFQAKFPDDESLLASAAAIPLGDQSVDIVLCIAGFHHLDSDLLPTVLSEVRRVLKPSGQFVCLDPVWNRPGLLRRLFWRLDQGATPRNTDALLAAIRSYLTVEHWTNLRFLHRYFLCSAIRPR